MESQPLDDEMLVGLDTAAARMTPEMRSGFLLGLCFVNDQLLIVLRDLKAMIERIDR